jgi:hypothetical protein
VGAAIVQLRQQLRRALAGTDQIIELIRSSALNLTTYFLMAIFAPDTNHLHRWLAATEIQAVPSPSMTTATRPPVAAATGGI